MKKLAVILVVMGVLVALTACEPEVTITARTTEPRPGCGGIGSIEGQIAAGDKTTKVVHLQRRAGGEWKDWPGIMPGYVGSSGTWDILYQVPHTTNAMALRVRSEDRRYASNTVYVSPQSIDYPCNLS